jgi:hypothetical protein
MNLDNLSGTEFNRVSAVRQMEIYSAESSNPFEFENAIS